MTRQALRIGAAVMTTLLALLLLWQFRVVVVYVLFSLALAAATRPLIRRWSARNLALRVALVFLTLIVLGTFGFLLFVGGSAALREIQQLAQQVSVQDAWRQPLWLQGTSLQQALDTRLPPPSELFAAMLGDSGEVVLPAILGLTQGLASVVSGGLVIVLLSLYWNVDQVHFERLWLSLLPAGQRRQAREIWQTLESDLGAYIRSEAIQSLLAALLLGAGYWLLGSPYPTLLALTGALILLLPMVGAVLALLPPLVVGLLTGVPLSLITTLYTLLIMIFLRWWLEPRLSNRRRYNPILTVVILIALADAYGLLGIIIAPPLSAAFQILWDHLVSGRAAAGPSELIADLKARQARLWTTIEDMDEAPPPLVTSSMERLANLIEEAEPVLEATRAPANGD
ncbi:MAG TPA: AI-2E family transporter [Candidatus Sulfomarinibacteraceae bacterium]|nr:AI-2E family transporter [Candidatus Sulfomarinibacteraceae bacterium]